MKRSRSTQTKPASRPAQEKLSPNFPLTNDNKKTYTAEVRALFAEGDKAAHAARPASLFPLSMPRWFPGRRLEMQIAAEAKGPLHSDFVHELINHVALEYIVRWEEEEKDKWPPEKEEKERTSTTKKKAPVIKKKRNGPAIRKKKEGLAIGKKKKKSPEIIESSDGTDESSEENSESDDSPEYQPDDDDSSWDGSP